MSSTPDTHHDEHGWIRLRAQRTAAATADWLEALLTERGILVFARIDFSADARAPDSPCPPSSCSSSATPGPARR